MSLLDADDRAVGAAVKKAADFFQQTVLVLCCATGKNDDAASGKGALHNVPYALRQNGAPDPGLLIDGFRGVLFQALRRRLELNCRRSDKGRHMRRVDSNMPLRHRKVDC